MSDLFVYAFLAFLGAAGTLGVVGWFYFLVGLYKEGHPHA